MVSIKNNMEIISLVLTILIVISAVLFVNSKLYFENNIGTDSQELLWIKYLIKFYVAFSVLGLTANLILMHKKFIKMKGFHEG